MGITKVQTQTELTKRLEPLFLAASLTDEIGGDLVDLDGPIGYSLRYLGYTVSAFGAVSGAEVGQVTDDQVDEFMDIAELRCLELIMGNLDDVDIRVGPRSEKLSQLAAQVERKIKRLSDSIEKLYDYGLSTPTAGVMTTKFAEHD